MASHGMDQRRLAELETVIRADIKAGLYHGAVIKVARGGAVALEAAIGALRPHGRAALCGAISQYNAVEPPAGPGNLALMIGKRLTLRGFLVGDHLKSRPAFLKQVGGWLAEDRIRLAETIVDGVENAPGAFIGLMAGQNTGKMLVRVGGE